MGNTLDSVCHESRLKTGRLIKSLVSSAASGQARSSREALLNAPVVTCVAADSWETVDLIRDSLILVHMVLSYR